jgi:ABC-type nickel/cobalt efflux system permease component RcnA
VRRGAVALVALAVGAGVAGPAAAHPLGNFSINHYAALTVGRQAVEIRYVLDLAEIPTFQELQERGIAPDAGQPRTLAYADDRTAALARGLRLEVQGEALALEREAVEVLFTPGAAGLPTLKLGARYRAALPPTPGPLRLAYRDENHADRAGWKEIVVRAGDGVTVLASSAPAQDRSRALSDYPTDLLDSPPQDVSALVTFSRETVVVAGAARGEDPPRPPPTLQPSRRAGAGLTSRLLPSPGSPGLLLVALGIAAGLGAFHALEPGHGKTMVAAYLVGSRGTAWHAVVLGLVVTGSHTLAVYALGAVTLSASRYVLPEQIYPWLAVVTGGTIVGLGLYLLARRWAGEPAHAHAHHHHGHAHAAHGGHHAHPHDHAHGHDHAHADGHAHGAPEQPGDVSLRQLFALGVTGGLVPCPAALVVLLGAVSLGRTALGLLLIVAFSVGLAAVLVATGLLVVSARRFVLRVHGEGRLITRWLPLTSAAVITLAGVAMTVRALQALPLGGTAS